MSTKVEQTLRERIEEIRELWSDSYGCYVPEAEFVRTIISLLQEFGEELINDLEFRLVDNRISPYDEKYEIMKTELTTIRKRLQELLK